MAYDRDLANRLREALALQDGVREQAMFGGLAFLIGGHMALAASREGGLLLRCPPERTDELLSRAHAAPFKMRGRETEGWLRIEPAGVARRRELERWVAIGVQHARSLPPKRGG
jgi:hypothetical protein